MSKPASLALCALALVVTACGGSTSTAPSPAEGASTTTTEASTGSETPPRSPGIFRVGAVGSFRDAFQPVFHLQVGPDRITTACEAVERLRGHAAQVHAVAAPEHVDPDAWAEATAALVADVDALGAECDAHGTSIDARIDALHTSFHRVKDLSEGRVRSS